jgi:AcrR family transcriptional regulator
MRGLREQSQKHLEWISRRCRRATMPQQRKPKPPSRPRSTSRRSTRGSTRGGDERTLRLVQAMIDTVGEKGYAATTVADVVGRARVSRKTFYEHFANKQECLLRSADLITAAALRHVESGLNESGRSSTSARTEAALGELFTAAIENPGALRVSVVELGAAGTAGIEQRERLLDRFERLIAQSLATGANGSGISDDALRAIVGGVNSVMYRRISAGETTKLMAAIPDLVRWATSYYPTPPPMLKPPRVKRVPSSVPRGGRAPGTLAPHHFLGTRRGLARGDQNVSRSFVEHNQRERILDAVANLVAARGYVDLTVDDIATYAALSLKAFYDHFENKEEAFLVTYEVGHSKVLALVEEAYEAATDWKSGIRAGLATLLDFLAGEPAFAHVALVDALSVSPRSAERSMRGVSGFARLLVPGLKEAPFGGQPPPVTVEAVAGGIFELCLYHSLRGSIRDLPAHTRSATYIALAPFVGGEEAARMATERAA